MKKSSRLAAVIVARMDSTRLPGKVLADLGGLPLIELIRRRIERVTGLGAVVLATTSRPCDEPLVDCFRAAGGSVHQCPAEMLDDVASRFIAASEFVGASYTLRVNGDSPFPIPRLIEEAARMLPDEPDLVTNLSPRTYPYGTSVEWVRVESLKSELPGLDANSKEHLTKVFYDSPVENRISYLKPLYPPRTEVRLTIDEPSDLESIRSLVERLGGIAAAVDADLSDILAAVDTDTRSKSNGSGKPNSSSTSSRNHLI